MKISKVASNTARRLFGLCQQGGRLDEARLRTVIAKLVNDKPRDYHPILVALQRLTRLELERRKVTIESASPLDDYSRNRVIGGLVRQYGQGLIISWHTNPDLIGGLRIRVGNDVFDGSIKGRLNRLAAAF